MLAGNFARLCISFGASLTAGADDASVETSPIVTTATIAAMSPKVRAVLLPEAISGSFFVSLLSRRVYILYTYFV